MNGESIENTNFALIRDIGVKGGENPHLSIKLLHSFHTSNATYNSSLKKEEIALFLPLFIEFMLTC